MRAYLIAAATFWIAYSDAVGQVYRWVDERGEVHYTQTPPPPQAKKIERKDFRPGAPGNADLPYATQVAAKNYPVTLYTQPDCGAPCDQARAALVKRAVPFREVSVLGQREMDEMKRISGREDLPLLVVGSQFRTGFRESAINDLLDTAGYPPAGQRVPLESLRKTDPAPASAPAQPSQESEGGQPGAESK